MRLLIAASCRGIDTPCVQAEPSGHEHKVTLLMEVNQKQVGQLSRDWYAIVDALDVHPSIAIGEIGEKTRVPQAVPANTPPPPAPFVLSADRATQQALA